MSEDTENSERDVLPEVQSAIYFVAESMGGVADKLNDMIGNFYKDTIGNVWRLTGYYYFQAERVATQHVAEPGSTNPPMINVLYEVVALPYYESVGFLSDQNFSAQIRGALGDKPIIVGGG